MKIDTESRQWLVLIVAVILASGYGVYFFVSASMRQAATASWTPTPAEIQSVHLHLQQGREMNLNPLRVNYEYVVAGHQYIGTRYTYSPFSQSAAKEVIKSFAPGQAVTAYVDPSDPRNAVLAPGSAQIEGATWRVVVLLSGIILVCVVVLLVCVIRRT